MVGPTPTAADRAMAIVTSFRLSEEDEELGEELFEIVENMVQGVLDAETNEELEIAGTAISNTIIVLAALIDGLIDQCPKEIELAELASQLTGSLA